MSSFPVYTIESAPEKSRPVLKDLQQAFGMIPNLAGALAGSPILVKGFFDVFKGVRAGSFSEAQLQTLLLTNAVTNVSRWPVAFHTFLALKEGVERGDTDAIRRGELPREPKLAALSRLTRTLIEKRGRLDDQDIERFLSAGFGKDLLLETITIVAASTITNYTGSVTNPPLEPMLQAHAWND